MFSPQGKLALMFLKSYSGISKKLDLREVQDVLAKSWKPHLEQTNVKLLWECVDWMYGQLKLTCKRLKIPTPRTKYLVQKEKHFGYMRMRKKPWKLTTKRTRSLLHLLEKLIYEQKKIEDQYRIDLQFPEKYYQRRRVIGKVLAQQKEMFTTGTHRVSDRIVSIAKNYVRPIVLGKEVKKVEFGAKVNMIQVGRERYLLKV